MWHYSCNFNCEDTKRGDNMNLALRQRTTSVIELQESVSELQPLRQYLDLLKTSLERYEYLKKSGVSEVILYTEKGLIDRQMQFLSKACAQLTR
jgi:flagellar biosynthesis chaperone FliJ